MEVGPKGGEGSAQVVVVVILVKVIEETKEGSSSGIGGGTRARAEKEGGNEREAVAAEEGRREWDQEGREVESGERQSAYSTKWMVRRSNTDSSRMRCSKTMASNSHSLGASPLPKICAASTKKEVTRVPSGRVRVM
jgi:hypothetical protein